MSSPPGKYRSILFVVPSLKAGGGNRVAIELANSLVDNYTIYIWYPNRRDFRPYPIDDKIQLRAVGLPVKHPAVQFFNILILFVLARLRRSAFSVIVTTGPTFGPFLPFLGMGSWHHFIQADDVAIFDDGTIIRSRLVIKLYKSLTNFCYRANNVKFLFNSRYTYKRFLEHSRRVDVPAELVHPALDHAIFRNRKEKGGLKASRPLAISHIARAHPWKGFRFFIEAMTLLPDDLKRRVAVTIISSDDLSSFAIPASWRVIVPESDLVIADCLRNSDIFVSSSLCEGFGLPALEAMACGCAVVTSDSGGCREYARHHANCLLYPPGDAAQMASGIGRLAADPALRRRLSAAGIRTAAGFTWQRSRDQLLRVLDLA